MYYLKKYFSKISVCPLCNSKKKRIYKKIYSNKYSEIIANDLKIGEKKLLIDLKNFQCKSCKLVYKNYWFKKKYLNYFYNKIDPIHSKGWDVNSNFFSKQSFLKILKKLSEKNLNYLKKNEYKRSAISILSSALVPNKKKKFINNYIEQINKTNIEFLIKKKSEVTKLIVEPKNFSRFSGFGDEKLFSHIENNIGKINNILEIGCPRWGFINNRKLKINKKSFLIKKTCGYWNKQCKLKGKSCISTLNKDTKLVSKISNYYDFTSLFLYLDHTTKPLKLMKKILKKSKSCGIILESGASQLRKGIAIQHFTLWNNFSIKFLAKLCQKNVDDSFKQLEKIGNKFFLIY